MNDPSTSSSFHDLHRPPDSLTVFTETGARKLSAASGGRWQGDDIEVTTVTDPDSLRVSLSAPASAVTRLHLRWRFRAEGVRLILGDACL